MTNSVDLTPVKKALEKEKSTIFILFGQNATVDHVASGLGLYLVFKQLDKEVTIASPTELRAEFSRLVGLNQVQKNIGNKNLVITFKNYTLDNIEKISHNDGIGGKLELVIEPKSGQKAPDPKNIDFSFRGATADLVFLVGISRLEDLGSIYDNNRKLFNDTTTVAFNRRQNPSFPSISVIDDTANSFSEIVYEFAQQLDLKVEGDTASNFLAGLDYATNRFQNPLISAGAFLTAGKLLEAGAKRQPPRITSASQVSPTFKPPTFPRPKPNAHTPTQQPFQSNQNQQPSLPTLTPPQPNQASKNQNNNQDKNKPPKDWLEPKIYKGGTRV